MRKEKKEKTRWREEKHVRGRAEGEDSRGRGCRKQSEWDKEFSLGLLRCLYTRCSCMAGGHISVSRERGAPPKNQIECKNRINSSCQTWKLCSPGWLASRRWGFLTLFLSLHEFRGLRARLTTLGGRRAERPITSHISSYSALVCRASDLYHGPELMNRPLFIAERERIVAKPPLRVTAFGRHGAKISMR